MTIEDIVSSVPSEMIRDVVKALRTRAHQEGMEAETPVKTGNETVYDHGGEVSPLIIGSNPQGQLVLYRNAFHGTSEEFVSAFINVGFRGEANLYQILRERKKERDKVLDRLGRGH